MPPPNPFETSKTKIVPEPVEGLPSTSGIRRQDLPTHVRKYADKLAAQIKEIYAKYGAANFEELKANKKLSAQDARKVADLLKAFQDSIKDTQHIKAIEKKIKANQLLDKDDLIFIYETKSPQSFGFHTDPRLKALRDQRNPKEDAPIVFECQPNEIAWSKEDITKNTKAYIGPLFPGIFKLLGHLEHLYLSFPEGKIRRQTIEIGGQTEQQLEAAFEAAGSKISPNALHMLRHEDFTTAKNPEQANLIRLTVADLGFDHDPTTDEIYAKAEELGLELCPAEVGPHLRLDYKDQPLGEWLRVAMKQISDPGGDPGVFSVERRADGAWLDVRWAGPAPTWDPDYEFVFRLRK
ncbi:MAG: hypothetical protein WC892_05200 [Patescibacteria group bacterium]